MVVVKVAKVSQEVSYISFATAAAACLRQKSTMKGEWILSDLMQTGTLNRGAEWIGNWLALPPVTSITTHNHSCPVPLVALHMKSQIEASQSFSDDSRERCGGVADMRVQGIWLASSLSYRMFDLTKR